MHTIEHEENAESQSLYAVQGAARERARFVLSNKKLYHWLPKVLSEAPVGHALRSHTSVKIDVRPC